MNFDDLVAGDSVFLDANTLVYHFTSDPVFEPACTKLLQRIEKQELDGFLSTHILSEMAHRLMTIEAIQKFGWPIAGIAQRLRKHPSEIGKLSLFRQAVEDLLQSRIQVLVIPPAMVASAAMLSQNYGLLSNDALIVAVMQANNLSKLASNDPDFDQISGVARYAPV